MKEAKIRNKGVDIGAFKSKKILLPSVDVDGTWLEIYQDIEKFYSL